MINVKNSENSYFEEFKNNNNTRRYQEDCNDFNLREKIREDLLKKQNFQCAYCETKLNPSNDNMHIEHIRARSTHHHLECEYTNLVLSCNSNESCGRYKDSKGGHWQDDYIHPVLDNPEKFFRFMANGEIVPKKELKKIDEERAKKTIQCLNLNLTTLVNSRKSIWKHHEYLENIDLEDILKEIKSFENVIKSLFE